MGAASGKVWHMLPKDLLHTLSGVLVLGRAILPGARSSQPRLAFEVECLFAYLLDCLDLCLVAHQGAGGVGVDVVDLRCSQQEGGGNRW